MRWSRRSILMACVSAVILALWVNAVRADHFRELSIHHTDFGVSQLLVGTIPGGQIGGVGAPLKLLNPNHVTQIAAALVYERSNEERGKGTPEVFLGCIVRELSPHAAIGIAGSVLPDSPKNTPWYVEVISVAREKVRGARTRLADGLGIVAKSAGFEGDLFLVHPGLFSLPSNDVVPGQRQAAIDCVCGELAPDIATGLDPDIFEDFGIRCPGQRNGSRDHESDDE